MIDQLDLALCESDPAVCPACDGTGEGIRGYRCHWCRGHGEVYGEREECAAVDAEIDRLETLEFVSWR